MYDILKILIEKFFGPLINLFKKRQLRKRLNPLALKDGEDLRYFSWRGRGGVHLIKDEGDSKQLYKFQGKLCDAIDALAEQSGMKTAFCMPENIIGEIVYEFSPDFKAKWRLLGGDSLKKQVLVLMPRQ